MNLTARQQQAAAAGGSILLFGPAGTGKTTAVKARLKQLLLNKTPAYTILVLVAEPEHRDHFLADIYQADVGPVADLKVSNYVGLAREMVSLFWPLVARQAGFRHAHTAPTWLSYDLAQLLMWEVVTPLLDSGHFADLRLRPQQIVSQLLDNLNRAALNRLTVEQAIQRQIDAWVGEEERRRHLRDAERAALAFRRICHANNLLDLSLAIDVFNRHVVEHPEFSRYFSERFRHLLVDNIEEQTAAGQFFVGRLLGVTESAVIALDDGGGYKRFLAADPDLAADFRQRCDREIVFQERLIETQGVYHLARRVHRFLLGSGPDPDETAAGAALLGLIETRYRREMLSDLGGELRRLMAREQIEPGEIAIIVPYMDGALRYKLTQSLREAGIPYQLSRRRASPREEPRVRAWMTWLAIAHPDWEIFPTLYDVAEALTLTISGLDPVRAALAAKMLYQPAVPELLDPVSLSDDHRLRVGEDFLARIDDLRLWLLDHGSFAGEGLDLDFFIHQLFTDLLSRPAFSPMPDMQAAAVCDWLVRLATRIRSAAPSLQLESRRDIGRAFIEGVRNGLVTAHPPDLGDPPDPNGVYIGTIYSYLLSEKISAVQVWLESAATGWWDIPRQPLSNAFVLSENWGSDQLWTLDDDARIRNEMLSRVVSGLCARCTRGVLLATSELDRRGVRQDGALWRALQIPLAREV